MSTTSSGILTKHEIQKYGLIKRLEGPGNYKPVESDEIQATTYDLRIGEAHFEKLQIAPYGSALIQLDEIVDTHCACVKENVLIVGRFDLKLQEVSHGLISQQATQVEPFYKGRLFCYVHNLSSKPLDLSFRDPFATIEFLYVSKPASNSKRDELVDVLKKHNEEKYKKPYCMEDNLGIKDIRYFLHARDDNPEHFGLSLLAKDGLDKYLEKNFDNIVQKVNKKINKNLKIITIILPIILPIFISLLLTFLNNYLNKQNSSDNNTNENVNQVLRESKFDNILGGEETK